jgi:hypothetical protein
MGYQVKQASIIAAAVLLASTGLPASAQEGAQVPAEAEAPASRAVGMDLFVSTDADNTDV